MNKAQEARKVEFQGLIEQNDKALCRAILAIYERQTRDEQVSEVTTHNNKRGFTGLDAEFGSSLAKQILGGRVLSVKQIGAARKMMKKYCGQLVLVAEEKAARQAVQ